MSTVRHQSGGSSRTILSSSVCGCVFVEGKHTHKKAQTRDAVWDYPVEETATMARGFTRSVSNRVRLPLPSRLAVSIRSMLESTQNISLRVGSSARPSGLTRSAQ